METQELYVAALKALDALAAHYDQATNLPMVDAVEEIAYHLVQLGGAQTLDIPDKGALIDAFLWGRGDMDSSHGTVDETLPPK